MIARREDFRLTFRLALPLILAELGWMSMGIVDTVMVGRLPDSQMLVYIVPSLWLDWMQARHGEATVFMHWPRLQRAALMAGAIVLWVVMSAGTGPTPFVYQGF